MKKIWLLILLMLIARGADLVITHHYTPDFKHEGNPLVVALVAQGWGWAELIALNIIAVAIFGAGLIYWHKRPIITQYNSEIKNVWDFASFSYFGKIMSRKRFIFRMLYALPKTWGYLLYNSFSIMPLFLIAGSAYVVFCWVILWYYQSAGFRHLYNITYPLSVFLPTILIAFIAQVNFYRVEYKKYLSVINL